MSEKKAVIFCSASYNIDPEYNQAARQVVRAACLHGYGIVSGGTVKGTMGHVAEEASKYGCDNVGVIPRFMKDVLYPNLTEVVWTETMAERKTRMREGTCLAIALPGGIGTMDELSETICLAKMNLYPGRVIVYNLNGFYDFYRQQLDLFVEKGMLDEVSRAKVSFPRNIEEFEGLL